MLFFPALKICDAYQRATLGPMRWNVLINAYDERPARPTTGGASGKAVSFHEHMVELGMAKHSSHTPEARMAQKS